MTPANADALRALLARPVLALHGHGEWMCPQCATAIEIRAGVRRCRCREWGVAA